MGEFRSFSHSAKGVSHKKSELPCQDASLDSSGCITRQDAAPDNSADSAKKTDSSGEMSIAVVADGHGSPQYFRSDRGSKIAVEVTLEGIREFIRQNIGVPEVFVNGGGKKVLDRLVRHVISSWFTRVAEDECADPISEDDKIASLEDKYKDRYLNDPNHQYFCHAYGTTLIAAAITRDYWFGFHIGDGKCEALYEDGVWKQPIPWDDKCFLNSTTSICDDNSINEFRYWLGFRRADGTFAEYSYGIDGQYKDGGEALSTRPIAVFIGTDGVDDTYPVYDNEKHLESLYRAVILSIAATDDFENAKAQIFKLTERLAEQGSQDDVSIAGIVGVLKPELIGHISLQAEFDKENEKLIEVQKDAEAKKQAVQAAKTKFRQAKNCELELRNKFEQSGMMASLRESDLKHLRDKPINIKRAKDTARIKGNLNRFREENEKAKGELLKAKSEAGELEQRFHLAEDESKEAEAQALMQEEKAAKLQTRLETFQKQPESHSADSQGVDPYKPMQQEGGDDA
ncbi:MAG: protein phosphatase 2C domain-containing protein [Clostridiales Family XIII bacterium]|jgi:hypothetical protein|nr:protein phosphatase 2C domain-containing protein [Clostridiales Family XIII bacterium]